MTTSLRRKFAIAGCTGALMLGAAGCGSNSSTSSGQAGGQGGGATSSSTDSALAALSSVKSLFKQFVYKDPTTGKSLPYNLYIPAGYTSSKSYPLVQYIADSSLVGQSVTAPLSQYGALIWASSTEQAKHPSFVLVPEYPETTIEDQNGH